MDGSDHKINRCKVIDIYIHTMLRLRYEVNVQWVIGVQWGI